MLLLQKSFGNYGFTFHSNSKYWLMQIHWNTTTHIHTNAKQTEEFQQRKWIIVRRFNKLLAYTLRILFANIAQIPLLTHKIPSHPEYLPTLVHSMLTNRYRDFRFLFSAFFRSSCAIWIGMNFGISKSQCFWNVWGHISTHIYIGYRPFKLYVKRENAKNC